MPKTSPSDDVLMNVKKKRRSCHSGNSLVISFVIWECSNWNLNRCIQWKAHFANDILLFLLFTFNLSQRPTQTTQNMLTITHWHHRQRTYMQESFVLDVLVTVCACDWFAWLQLYMFLWKWDCLILITEIHSQKRRRKTERNEERKTFSVMSYKRWLPHIPHCKAPVNVRALTLSVYVRNHKSRYKTYYNTYKLYVRKNMNYKYHRQC